MMKPLRSFACACALALCSASSQAATFGDFEYEESESSVTITDYAGSATTLEIPAAINGKPVTAIGKRAFDNCDTLTSVIIPDSVTAIGTGVFYGNDSMTSAIIGNNVTTIGASAFAQCQKLTSVTIGDGVTTIDNLAFSYCFDLRSLTLPDGLTTIGDSAFAWSGLTSMKFPDSVTTIGSFAFANCRLTSITIPDSVTAIGTNAFAQCSLLAEIVFTGAPPTYEIPSGWNGTMWSGTTWKYPAAEQEAWQKAIASGQFEGNITFKAYTVRFDETIPEGDREWLEKALEAQGFSGMETLVGDAALLEAFRPLGVLPHFTQDGTTLTLDVELESAFAALREAAVAGEIYGSAQLDAKVDEIALTAPLIEVGQDTVTVEIGFQTAETLGDWLPADLTNATVETSEAGTLRVRLPKPTDSTAAFYKFVVPDGRQP